MKLYMHRKMQLLVCSSSLNDARNDGFRSIVHTSLAVNTLTLTQLLTVVYIKTLTLN